MAELIRPHNNQPHFQQRKLMQNCDLPPPTKLLSGSISNGVYVNNKVVSKALQRSETRAREAERRLEKMKKEKDSAVNALVSETMRLMAYKRLLTMLEMQIEMLKSKTGEQDKNNGDGIEKWKVGLMIFLGLAGLGFSAFFDFSWIKISVFCK